MSLKPHASYIASMTSSDVNQEAALEDVVTRFLYNCPEEELKQPERLFMQIEQAWWYYEDFYADVYSTVPHVKTMISFCKLIFNHSELLRNYENQVDAFFGQYSSYKGKIPGYGCILLNRSMTKCLLVCGYKGSSWSFPKGKVNQGEDGLDAACRETLEETGFDPTDYMREEDYIQDFRDGKLTTLYIGTGISEKIKFATQTRKEIGKVQFHDIATLSDKDVIKTYYVYPFLDRLKKWIARNRNKKGVSAQNQKQTPSKKTSIGNTSSGSITGMVQNPASLSVSSKKLAKATKSSKKNSKSEREKGERSASNGNMEETIEGGAKRWSAQQMFAKNEAMLGRKLEYDGNAHNFGASHPRYVNYLERDGRAGATQAKGTGGDVDVNGAHGVKVDWNSEIYLCPTPFLFNMEKVNAAVNNKLLSAEKLLSLIGSGESVRGKR